MWAVLAIQPVLLDAMSMSTLQNLPGVGVQVQQLNTDALDFGLSEDELRELLAETLNEAGVTVYSEEKLSTAPGSPTLELKILMRQVRGESSYIFSIELALQEMVSLERPTESLEAIYAPTWEKTVLGITNQKTYVKVGVRKLLERFIQEYKREN